jgi:transposase
MTADEFVAWLDRHRIGPVEAARRLGVGYQSVYNWSTRRKRVPKQVAVLTAYIDTYGWPDKALSAPQREAVGLAVPQKQAA